MTRPAISLSVAASVAVLAQDAPLHLPPLDRVLPPRAEVIYQLMAPRIDTRAAVDAVTFIGPLWRLAGNPDYDRSLDFLADRLVNGGWARGATGATRATGATGAVGTLRIDSYENTGQGWEQLRATLSIEGDRRQVVLSREQDRVALCINSFSTAPGGVVVPLVDVGAGAASDFEGKDVKGAVVLGNAAVGGLWTRAVRERGAVGVISTDLARYTRPDVTPDVLQWGAIPYDETSRSFGFKATPRAAVRLRDALAAGPVRLHVEIATTFHRGPNRTLVAEIPGRQRSGERVVLVAHVQEPGANDNASGAGTLLAAALAINDAIAKGLVPPPRRTLTFIWLDEIHGSERWIKEDSARASRVVAMMSLDMTGQDTSKTGGTFLIEKSPDPSAIWPRPSDPHSEWGAGSVDRRLVRGHLLNDFHLAVALRRARETGWVVRTNPYEGGSDHTVFTAAGVPALLNWHFTDRYYHTNQDTIDKTSPVTMGHVAAIVATSATFLASADSADEPALLRLLDEAERTRFETEQRNGATEEILAAWKQWYQEARASVATIVR
jgi:aminopeptidase YwaD